MKPFILRDLKEADDYNDMTPEQQKAWMEILVQSSPRDIIDRYLQWHGILGYTDTLIDVFLDAFEIEKLVQYNWDDEAADYRETYQLDDDTDLIAHALNNNDTTHMFRVLARIG